MSRKKIVLIFFSFVSLILPLASLAVSPSEWMKELYSRPGMRETRLIDVAIPGTHNSGTYGINLLSKLEPGESFFYLLLRPMVASWSRCQFRSVGQQLRDGIRYLDLRVAYNRRGVPLVVHGLVSVSLQSVISDVKRFVSAHPQEVVLIDATLSWGYKNSLAAPAVQGESEQQTKARQLRSLLKSQFEDVQLDYSPNLTFAHFWDEGKSVLLLDSDANQVMDYWPNSIHLEVVKSYLDSAFQNATYFPGDFFRNHQVIFSPPENPTFYFMPKNLVVLFGNQNALSQLSLELRNAFPSMINDWKQKGYRVNIVTTDFYEKFNFIPEVIRLNGGEVPGAVSWDDQVFQ